MFVGHGCQWTGDSMRRAYDATVRTYEDVGIDPTSLGAKAPGVTSAKFGSFKHKRRYLEKADFDKVENFCILRLAEVGKDEVTESTATVQVDTQVKSCEVGIVLAALGKSATTFADLFKSLAAFGQATYGYIFYQRMVSGPVMYVVGANYGDEGQKRHPEQRMNVSWWVYDHQTRLGSLLLRDIYPRSYLSADYLSAPIGKTAMTLREWIEDDPASRGELKPFTETLTEWAPPVKNIPEIREALYRAGRVFYWRFFCPRNFDPDNSVWVDEVNYRPDPRAPWEAPEPIPEIYRAEFYKDKDPGLVY